jgi:hypothetical protein
MAEKSINDNKRLPVADRQPFSSEVYTMKKYFKLLFIMVCFCLYTAYNAFCESETGLGGPEVTHFQLVELGMMYNSDNPFWARVGKELYISVYAKDDMQIKTLIYEYRMNAEDSWSILKTVDNNDNTIGDSYGWIIPDNTTPTDNAQVRIRIIDNQNNETIKTSNYFSIYSNLLEATVEPLEDTYKVGSTLKFKVAINAAHAISRIKITLSSGLHSIILNEYQKEGVHIESTYEWDIPDDNIYVSTYATLEIQLTDNKENNLETTSKKFVIAPNTELPAPFIKSICLYDNEHKFPDNALSQSQHIDIKFLKLDDNNTAHATIYHDYKYYQDTNTASKLPDTYISEKNNFYITYTPSTKLLSEKIKIINKDYRLLDMAIYNDIPYYLLESNDGKDRFAYTYKNGNSFVSPIIIQNSSVPEITNISTLNETATQDFSNSTKFIYANGYFWYLEIFGSKMYRHSFLNGVLGDSEKIQLNNDIGIISSYRIEPVADDDIIYFINPDSSKLVKIDTNSLSASTYQIPFTIGGERTIAYKTAIAAKDGKVFIFGNGKIYKLQNNALVEVGNIEYTFDSNNSVDYSSQWNNNVYYAKTIMTENNIYLLLGVNLTVTKPSWTEIEILQLNTDDNTLTKRVASVEKGLNGGQYAQRSDFLYYGDNKVIVSYASDSSYSSKLHIYNAGLQMLDLETGDISDLGPIQPIVSEEIALGKINNLLYVFAYNCKTYKTDISRISISNLDNKPIQIQFPQFVKYNKKLYVVWGNGRSFDGTWNTEQNNLNNSINKATYALQLYPYSGNPMLLYNEFFGDCLSVNDNYLLVSNYGKIFMLNPDFTINQQLLDLETSFTSSILKSFENNFIGSFTNYNGQYSLSLYDVDLKPHIYNIVSDSNKIVTYEDEIIIIGRGAVYKTPSHGKQLIKKVDLFTGEENSIILGEADQSNYQKVDINKNKYVAVSWSKYLAVGDLSGDIIAPEISFTNMQTEITNNTPLTLTWHASDNRDELVKIELYHMNNSPDSPIKTFYDVSNTKFTIHINETSHETADYKLIAYDHDGNTSYDAISFELIEPVTFESFTVNKSTVELEEKIIFSWLAKGAKSKTDYIVYKRKKGNSAWKTFFQATGESMKMVFITDFIGEYEFKITAGDDEMQLPNSVIIKGEILEYDYEQFSKEGTSHYVDDRSTIIKWGINEGLTNPVEYDLYIKHDEEDQFKHIVSTIKTSFGYRIPDTKNAFQWKVMATYRNKTYESKPYQVELHKLTSPDILSIKLINNHTNNPQVVIQFDKKDGIDLYAVTSMDSSGKYTELARISVCQYTDATIQYGKQYEYSVRSVSGDLVADPGQSKQMLISVLKIDEITINSPDNGVVLDSNAITINYKPIPEQCFENYEILIGEKGEQPQTIWESITKREVVINNLDDNTEYCVEIYPLDHNNIRTSSIPARLNFTTPQPLNPICEINVNVYYSGYMNGLLIVDFLDAQLQPVDLGLTADWYTDTNLQKVPFILPDNTSQVSLFIDGNNNSIKDCFEPYGTFQVSANCQITDYTVVLKPDYTKGDVNRDEKINLADVKETFLLFIGMNLENECQHFLADVAPFPYGDGLLRLDDVKNVFRLYIGLLQFPKK